MAEEWVREEEKVWARHGGLDLLARIYRPPEGAVGPFPAIVEVHGGAWSTGDRNGGVVYDRALALAGFVVVAIDFRQGPDFKHPAASADVTAAVRWVRLNASWLEADAARIGLAGSSSGGHLAMLAGLKPDAPEHRGVPISAEDGGFAEHDALTAAVNFVIALWPVSDPAARYRYARRARIEGLQRGGEAYFSDEAAMWDASIPRLVTAGEAPVLPPLLVVQPGEDSNIPQEMTFDLLRAYQARGGRVDYAYFPGMPHAFGHRPSAQTSEMIEIMTAFARRWTPHA